MSQRIELAGQMFNHFTVLRYAERNKWVCRCSCGKEVWVPSIDLRSGRIKSCGCQRPTLLRGYMTGHGMSGTPTYETWNKMRARCNNPKATQYKHYGGRGVVVCERWLQFTNFLTDMGVRPEGKTLDRIDVDGNYEPSNCRWATQREQMSNTRSNVVYEGKSIEQWGAEMGVTPSAIAWRIRTYGNPSKPDTTRQHRPLVCRECNTPIDAVHKGRGYICAPCLKVLNKQRNDYYHSKISRGHQS